MTTLITGATGFLGVHLARRLLNEGEAVRIFVRTPAKAEALVAEGAQIFIGDIAEETAARRAAEGCTTFYHVAAALNGDYATQYRANVEGTRTMIRVVEPATRFVHVSSIAVYGNNYPYDIDETRPPAPGGSAYGVTKTVAEQVVISEAQKRDIEWTIIRPGMIYGPGAGLWTRGVFGLARRNPTPFFGDGSGSAHAIYVDDVVDLMITAARHPAGRGEIFNATPDPAPTWREYVAAYSRLAGHQNWRALPISAAHIIAGVAMLAAPRHSMARDFPDMIGLLTRRMHFKMDKARDLLGWSPKIDLQTGVALCTPYLHEMGLL